MIERFDGFAILEVYLPESVLCSRVVRVQCDRLLERLHSTAAVKRETAHSTEIRPRFRILRTQLNARLKLADRFVDSVLCSPDFRSQIMRIRRSRHTALEFDGLVEMVTC